LVFAVDIMALALIDDSLAYTSDGGVTWTACVFLPTYPTHMELANDSTFLIASGGGVFKSRDHGKNLDSCFTAKLSSISAEANTPNLIGTSSDGTSLYRSSDYGNTWIQFKLPPNTEQYFLIGRTSLLPVPEVVFGSSVKEIRIIIMIHPIILPPINIILIGLPATI